MSALTDTEGLSSRKHEFIQIDANIVNSFSHFLIGYLDQFDSWNMMSVLLLANECMTIKTIVLKIL